jgi:hypothetical protein
MIDEEHPVTQTAVPAQAGTHLSTDQAFEPWIPAFAGTAENR